MARGMLEKIDAAGKGDPLYCLRSILPELSDINEYSKHFHHNQNPSDWNNYPINDAELKTYIERTLKVISGVLGAGPGP